MEKSTEYDTLPTLPVLEAKTFIAKGDVSGTDATVGLDAVVLVEGVEEVEMEVFGTKFA